MTSSAEPLFPSHVVLAFRLVLPLVHSLRIHIAFDQRVFCKSPQGGKKKKKNSVFIRICFQLLNTAGHRLFHPEWLSCSFIMEAGAHCLLIRVNAARRCSLSKTINHPLDVRLVRHADSNLQFSYYDQRPHRAQGLVQEKTKKVAVIELLAS